MDNFPRQTLVGLIAEHGPALAKDPRRVEAFLRDLCGEHKREIFLLVNALKFRVADDLLASNGVPSKILLARLSRQLEESMAVTPDAAFWVVETWAIALGVISHAKKRHINKNPILPPPPPTFDSGSHLQPELGSLSEMQVAEQYPAQYYQNDEEIQLAPPTFADIEFSGFGRRLVAFTIDQFILLMPYMCFSSFVSVIASGEIGTVTEETMSLLICGVLLPYVLFVFWYNTVLPIRSGQTWGKKIMGIKIITTNGHALNFGHYFVRCVGYLISYSIFYIGFLMPLWTEKKQALHDKIAGTCVVRT